MPSEGSEDEEEYISLEKQGYDSNLLDLPFLTLLEIEL